MKKPAALIVIVIFFLFAALAGCGNSEPENPSGPSGPTATHTPLPVSFMLDDFEDGDTTNNLGGTWTFHDDSGDGGASQISSSGLISPGEGESSYALHVTATLDAEISTFLDSDYVTCGIHSIGYVSVETAFPSTDLLVHDYYSLIYDSILSDGNNISIIILIYNSAGQYVSYRSSEPTSWHTSYISFSSNFDVPSGASYTKQDVLNYAEKLVFLVRYAATGGSSKTEGYFIDNVKFEVD